MNIHATITSPADAIPPEVRRVQETVASFYGIPVAALTDKARGPEKFSWPRQVAMRWVYYLFYYSAQEVGGFFGGRGHGAVLYASDTYIERYGEKRCELERLAYLLSPPPMDPDF